MLLFSLRTAVSRTIPTCQFTPIAKRARRTLYTKAAVVEVQSQRDAASLDKPPGTPVSDEHPPAENAGSEIGSAEWRRELYEMKLNDVTIVRDARSASEAIRTLCELDECNRVVAWDTETTGVNPKKQSPYGNGRAICATAYAGSDVDFGNGPHLFIDCVDGDGGPALLQHFKAYFEERRLRKAWHNYSFDRHILYNHGILARGFAADTMHMARLVDSSRQRYSLEELAKDYLQHSEKKSMGERFGHRRVLKNGGEGKDIVIPDTLILQQSLQYRREWIEYATMDARLTYELREKFWRALNSSNIDGTNCVDGLMDSCKTLYDVYVDYLIPFGNMLTDMERFGFKVDVEQLRMAEHAAEKDRLLQEDSFRNWAAKHSPDARYMNVHSDRQKLQLLFAPCRNKKNKQLELEKEKTFVVEQTGVQAERLLAEEQENDGDGELAKRSKDGKKLRKDVTLRGLGKSTTEFTKGGWPSVSALSLQKLAGKPRSNPPEYGEAGDPEMCHAVADVIEANLISSLLSNFIVPLQSWPGADGRIHASLNLNTETGRLSSRRPNLQNLPALEKDRYGVRRAFVSDEGKKLIVADYGQLELRLMAHITRCESMLEAFAAGGDFHSRTAIGMFEHVADAVARGDCLLERTDGGGDTPLVKDMFGTERRRAKTLNFSIAYGKTAIGLAKDWNVSVQEAQDTVELWYRERQEVRQWQYRCRGNVRHKGYVETILGRRRHLPDAMSVDKRVRAHAERAAINAPLQGSAADLVMAAMIELHRNATLQALGWKVIMQIHDEIILEGPEHSTDIALPVVRQVMCHPLKFPLLVDLTVDSKIVDSWYDAK